MATRDRINFCSYLLQITNPLLVLGYFISHQRSVISLMGRFALGQVCVGFLKYLVQFMRSLKDLLAQGNMPGENQDYRSFPSGYVWAAWHAVFALIKHCLDDNKTLPPALTSVLITSATFVAWQRVAYKHQHFIDVVAGIGLAWVMNGCVLAMKESRTCSLHNP